MTTSLRLANKTAIVTGGGSGIGAAIARRFVREGANCVIADIDSAAGMATAREIGGTTEFVRTDVTDEAEVSSVVTHTKQTFGRLDIMVNNAGSQGVDGSILNVPTDSWDRVMALLLRSVFLGIKHAGAVMTEQGGGAIINTASVAGVQAGLGAHAYTAAKHGVVGLTKSAAVELASSGVRVNALAPGGVATPLVSERLGTDLAGAEEALRSSYIAGRAAMPEDIAAAAVYLASDEGWLANGAVLVLDGANDVLSPRALRGFTGTR